ncbi:MAG: flagellar basal-body MS-ring/collar protein FliF [Pseudobdellovibrionaceae bacterium]
MNKIFGNIVVQFREFYKGLSPTKRASIVAVSVITFLAGLTLLMMVSGKTWAPLFTNIPSDQVPTIVAKLQEKNIPFELKEDGKTINIPSEMLHSTQMTLMAELGGSKIGAVGLEIFDKQDFGTSSYAQKVNYQRALQGELIRAINTLSAVRQSKVLLAMPSKKTFLEESSQPTASVVVELHPGKSLSPEQIRGIQHLVGSSVEGMDPDRVTVVDDRGKMMTRNSDSAASATSDLLDLKRKVESEFQTRIEDILAKVVGQGKIIAKVEASLNNKVVTSVEEMVDPEKTAIRSQQSEEEALDGSRTNPSGVPGSRANLPGAEDSGQVGFNQNVRKEIKTTNFEVPKTTRNVREAAGGLERISVAVLVDGIMETTKKEDGTEEIKWVPRNAAELAKFESLIKNAIGFNAARGDSVKVESAQFTIEDFSEADKLLTSLERKKLLHALFKWALLGFSLALFFFIVVRPFMQWITDSFQDSVEEMLPKTIEELEELQAVDNSLPGMSAALPMLEEAVDPDKAESELLKDRIMNLMTLDEENASSAFSMWLVRKDDK